MKRGRSPRHKGRKQSEKAIIEALDEGPDRWQEVYERVDMAKSTFNDSLKDLENKEEVERYYDKDERATLIRLTEKLDEPVERTLRHLENITVRSTLDLKKGRELLNENYVLDAVARISTLKWLSEPHNHWLSLSEYRDEVQKIDNPDHERTLDSIEEEFNEYRLVRVLARYFTDRYLLPNFSYGEYKGVLTPEMLGPENLFETEEKFQEFLDEKYKDRKSFPVIWAIEQMGIKKEFDELLLWIRPLLESDYFREIRTHREDLGLPKESNCPIVALREDFNLASAIFRREVIWYIHNELKMAWKYKMKME